MQKHRGDGKARRRAAGTTRWLAALRLRCVPLCLAGLVAVGGCKHNPPAQTKSSTSSDPLLGSATPPAAPRPAGASANAQGVAPPPPVPASLTSTAALASGNASTAALDPTHDLRISDAGRGPAAAQTTGSSAWSSGAALQRPEPITPTTAPNASPAGGQQAGGVDDALAQLQSRGVNYLRLERVDQDQWQLNCSVPNRQSPSVSTTYEAKGRSALDVIRTVLSRIDQSR